MVSEISIITQLPTAPSVPRGVDPRVHYEVIRHRAWRSLQRLMLLLLALLLLLLLLFLLLPHFAVVGGVSVDRLQINRCRSPRSARAGDPTDGPSCQSVVRRSRGLLVVAVGGVRIALDVSVVLCTRCQPPNGLIEPHLSDGYFMACYGLNNACSW